MMCTNLNDSREIIVIVGVSGVGKTTVFGNIVGYQTVDFGQIMHKLAVEQFGPINSPSDLSVRNQKVLQLQTLDWIREHHMWKPKLIIISHSSVRTAEGFLLGFTRRMLHELGTNLIVLVETTANNILSRREERQQYYPEESLDEINAQLKFDRCTYTDILKGDATRLVIFSNPDGKDDARHRARMLLATYKHVKLNLIHG